VIAEGDDETPVGEGRSRELERDVLAERRARRTGAGDSAQLKQAETAEVAVRELERQLTDLRRQQLETEHERERAREQLTDREHELRRVKQREYAEQQLRVEAEENVTRLRRRQRAELDRLQRHVEEARISMQSTGERAEELRARAQQERDEAERRRKDAERRLAGVERERVLAEQRCTSLAARLASVNDSCARLREGMLVLEGATATLRAEVEAERRAASARIAQVEAERGAASARIGELEHERAAADARVRELERALGPASKPDPGVAEAARREEMAGALAAAVERLRARVAVAEEPDEAEQRNAASKMPSQPLAPAEPTPAERAAAEPPPPAEPAPAEPAPAEQPTAVQVVPRQLPPPTDREPWLAAAIRGVATHRDPKLAAELVTELLPAQRLVVERSLSYGLRIAELESRWGVSVGQGRADVGALPGPDRSGLDFELEGRAADFAELAAGGLGRRLPRIAVRGSRRRLRVLRRARRRPLALWDLASAGIDVWPGLLLLALAEAIDPRWSVGERFTIVFEIEESPPAPKNAALYVQARDGAPLGVTSTPREEPATTVRLGERAFTCMFAGTPLPAGERVLVEGAMDPLELLIAWSDRAQGRSSAAASLRRSRA
jgi:hypothetical protein